MRYSLRIVLVSLAIAACDGDQGPADPGPPEGPRDPEPQLSALEPPSVLAGDPPFTLRAEGEGFVEGAVLRWDGAVLQTTRVSSTLLEANVGASQIAEPGEFAVTVANVGDGPISNALAFAVYDPAELTPTATSPGIAAGSNLTCGLSRAGVAYCWGEGRDGQLGVGETAGEPASAPRPIASDHRFVAVTVGAGTFACGLNEDGAAHCWGSNSDGQLGIGRDDYAVATPTPVAGGLTFRQVSAGLHHACALTVEGEAYCWGSDNSGQLGDARFGTPGPGGQVRELAPIRVRWNGIRFAWISAGVDHTCALTLAGEGVCWGRINYLGIGEHGAGIPSAENVRGPTLIRGHRFIALSASWRSTCALTPTGNPYCWESGDRPTRVAGAPVLTALSVGAGHTCGIAPDGQAYCWGDNRWGQLGTGTRSQTEPPTPVVALSDVVGIHAGTFHTCAVLASGEGFCWGQRGAGVLGDGKSIFRPEPVAVAGEHIFDQLAGSCGLAPAGGVLCWGPVPGGSRDLTGAPEYVPEPTPIASESVFVQLAATSSGSNRGAVVCGLTASGEVQCAGLSGRAFARAGDLVGATAVAVGSAHACALSAQGDAYCWGENEAGQLGNGTTTPSETPVRVTGGLRFRALAAGGRHTCALTTDGQAHCWGSDSGGSLGGVATAQCGFGPQRDPFPCSSIPLQVPGDLIFERLIAYGANTCGIVSADRFYCWGPFVWGDEQCASGYGDLIPCARTPAPVLEDVALAALVPGFLFTCALHQDGGAYCWGSNEAARLGNGSVRQGELYPVEVLGNHSFAGIHGLGDTICGRTAAGRAWCWGNAAHGQVGDGVAGFTAAPVPVESVVFR